MAYSASGEFRGSIWRRLYAFLAVALAVFVVAIAAVGFVCRGYRMTGVVSLPAGLSAAGKIVSVEQTQAALDSAIEQYKTARSETQADLQTYQTANAELRDFLSDHFNELNQLEKRAAGDAATVDRRSAANGSATDAAGRSARPALPPMVLNPHWKELQDELDTLKQRRTTLLVSMLPDHPQVQAVELSIADVEAKLNGVPKEIPGETDASGSANQTQSPIAALPPSAAANREQAAAEKPAAVEIPIAMLKQLEQTDAQYRKLTDSVTAAQHECRMALDRQNAAWRRKVQAEADQTIALAATPTLHAGANLRPTIFWSGLLSVIAGLLVASKARGSEAVFQTAAQVRQQLGLAVLGLLPSGRHAAPGERPIVEPHWIRRSIHVAEFALAGILVVLVIVSFADHQFFQSLLANPLSACSQKFFC